MRGCARAVPVGRRSARLTRNPQDQSCNKDPSKILTTSLENKRKQILVDEQKLYLYHKTRYIDFGNKKMQNVITFALLFNLSALTPLVNQS